MKIPTLEDIFYCMNSKDITSPDLEDEEKVMLRFLKTVTDKKNFKKSDADRIGEKTKAICRTAKCAGFVHGFAFAVKLLYFTD